MRTPAEIQHDKFQWMLRLPNGTKVRVVKCLTHCFAEGALVEKCLSYSTDPNRTGRAPAGTVWFRGVNRHDGCEAKQVLMPEEVEPLEGWVSVLWLPTDDSPKRRLRVRRG